MIIKSLYRSPVPCYVTGWYLIFDVVTLTDILVIWPWYIYTGTCHAYYLISDTGTCHAILIIWYLIPVLAMLDLSLNIWRRYLSWLSLDINTGTCHAILVIWYLIPVLVTLYLLFDIWYRYLPCYTYRLLPDTWYNNTWHLTCYHLVLVHLTWYCGTCIILHIHDYYFYRNLAWLLYCYQIFGTPELLYSWSPVLLNSCIPEPLKKGDSWYYTPDIILSLIPVVE